MLALCVGEGGRGVGWMWVGEMFLCVYTVYLLCVSHFFVGFTNVCLGVVFSVYIMCICCMCTCLCGFS